MAEKGGAAGGRDDRKGEIECEMGLEIAQQQ